MTPDQVKAARLLLGWSMSRLGMRSGTSVHTVRIFERTGQVAKLYGRMEQVDPVAAICATLEAAGVEFTDEDAPGVRLRKLVPQKKERVEL
jgi:transcriptional regulator with XRE-family HTH domain